MFKAAHKDRHISVRCFDVCSVGRTCDIFAQVAAKEIHNTGRVRHVFTQAAEKDIYALVVPAEVVYDMTLDGCKLGALDNVPISSLDDMYFNSIYGGEV